VNGTQSYYVRWFVSGSVQANVTVVVRNGHVVDVRDGVIAGAFNLGPAALVDGLVNAHTHLEFSSLRQPIPTKGRFTDWIRAVIQYRRGSNASVSDAIRSGIRESLESGTTLLGDIATTGWTEADYTQRLLPAVVFQEILGLLPDRIIQQKSVARTHLEAPADANSSDGTDGNPCHPIHGLSPHAPYSSHLELVEESVRLACENNSTVAMHIAETEAEIELLATGQGEFRQLLTELGLWRDEFFPGGSRPIDYLKILAQAPRCLVIHGNYLDEAELQFIASHPNMTLVYCPRTHAAFGHREHPWRRIKALGGRVAIGTDSRASNPDLSLFAESQFLAAENRDLLHVELLQMGSSNGRQALGIEASDRAIFTLLRPARPSKHPQESLFAEDTMVCGTMIDGRWVWLADEYDLLR
jgi:cytosine/adenosine deaminase-related metal-dependent hydrolase